MQTHTTSNKTTDRDSNTTVKPYTADVECYESFFTLTIRGDITTQNIKSIGDELYTQLTLCEARPPYSLSIPLPWIVRKHGIRTSDPKTKISISTEYPALTYDFTGLHTPKHRAELVIYASKPDETIDAVTTEFPLPQSITQQIRSHAPYTPHTEH